MSRQKRPYARSLSLIAGFTFACAAAPPVPDNLKPPATEKVLLKATGTGSQIYACKANPAGGPEFAWILDRPQADLLAESGATVGKHYKGPTWEASDGSKVTGQVEQRANAPASSSIPWLLLKAASHEGAGTFAPVTYIQRVDTEGGLPPTTGCDKSHAGAEVSVAYKATYFFYSR